ncbi:lipopolysaccharide/colanic/teichoic acid biosynthesis glycosyltransferase [Cerasibacillus quisquiliarum]|uniref:DNA-directed RNA polymerase subunit beta n=1 Tax=Cerasibacillus quisquiliarum TaxID=227865 RepID=A0A511V2T0_9BACI|nr:DNA-directed RNA polymerase subunit beta [Cerasibacillus quisquiliarum]MBB5147079.1 lipopolysaccharide/colanic/teichoic acid biosynthesis glycosyltransferase [Cerasibacillus quisquiliarum]GEN32043.1 hypothetical protein CQU01_22810 [Cerasibacillus quisquiliarum]
MGTKQLEKPATRKEHKQKKQIQTTQETETLSRRERKKMKKAAKQKTKRPRRRIFPIWLRLIVIAILAAAALIAGLMIGYGVLGDGDPKDAIKIETWQHIIDIVNKEK